MEVTLNPFEWVQRNANEVPGSVALATAKGTMPWKQFEQVVRQAASYLQQQGVSAGDFVGLSLPANLQILFTWASLFCGAVVVPIGSKVPSSLEGKLKWHFTVSEVVDGSAIQITTEVINEIQKLEPNVDAFQFKGDRDVVALLGTSGTTGERKFTVYDLGTLITRSTRSLWGEENQSGPIISLFGLGQAAGFFSNMQDLFFQRPMIIETGQVTLQSHLELVEKYRPSTLRGSPNQIVQLLGHPDALYHRINSIRTVSVIGSPLDNRMAKTILTAIPEVQINVGYGSTEAGISHRRVLTQLSQNKVDFLGKQVAAEVEIWGEKGERLGSGQSGLIAIRSDNMVREYFNNPEATEQHFKNGFFLSGDRGRIDDDGLLWMDGRESELINFGGTKIDPQRIDNEAVTYEELKDACAFLFSNAQGMQFIGLAVVPVEKTADIKALATKLNEALGPVLAPRRYFVVSSIPRNAMGKPMRNVLTEKLSEKPSAN